MVENDFGGVKVDVCSNGCKGIWFDWFELSKLDETCEGAGTALKDALAAPRVADENRGPISCPKCGIPMHIHKYRHSKQVSVDECYQCAGFFLDSGELKAIRDCFMSEEEISAYVDSIARTVPSYQQAVRQNQEQQARIRPGALRGYHQFLRLMDSLC